MSKRLRKFGFKWLQVALASWAFVPVSLAGPVGSCCSSLWSGAYIGGQLGENWNTVRWHYANLNFFNGPGMPGLTLLTDTFRSKDNSIIGGGNLGVNYQLSNWVFGAEVAALGTHLREQRMFSPPSNDTYRYAIYFISTAIAKVGLAYGNFLPFLDGGWAGANVNLTLNDPDSQITANRTQWMNGWTLGGGVDYGISTHFSVGLAYQYIELERTQKVFSCPLCGVGLGFAIPVIDAHVHDKVILARVNYFF